MRRPKGSKLSFFHHVINFYRFNGTTTFHDLTPVETAFASELIAYWLSFVRSGDPNSFKLSRSPVWTKYSATKRNKIVLQQVPDGGKGSGSTLEVESQEETARCAVVAGQVGTQQN